MYTRNTMSKILIVGSTHGHERIGLLVIAALKKLPITADNVEFIVGNPMASEKGIPFLENDLNRIFPGKEHGTYEEMRAFELSKKIAAVDVVIDIHSTKTTDLGDQSMIIVTKYDERTRAILDLIRPPKILCMKYKSENALISKAKIGIAFEYGKDDSAAVLQAILHDVAKILCHLGVLQVNPYNNPRTTHASGIYEAYDVLKKDFTGGYTLNKVVSNFVPIATGSIICTTNDGENVIANEDFYPILFGNNRYTEILGFKGRRLV